MIKIRTGRLINDHLNSWVPSKREIIIFRDDCGFREQSEMLVKPIVRERYALICRTNTWRHHRGWLYRIEFLAKYADQAFFCLVYGCCRELFHSFETCSQSSAARVWPLNPDALEIDWYGPQYRRRCTIQQSTVNLFLSRNVNYHIFQVECDH